MDEAEIQPLRTLILGLVHIVDFFLACQLCPCFLSLLVPNNIVELDKHKEADVITAECEQDLVASDVVGPVIFAINVASHNISTLHKPRKGQCWSRLATLPP